MKVVGHFDMGREINNLILPSGPTFPEASEGEVFLLTQQQGVHEPGSYVYKNNNWVLWNSTPTGASFPSSGETGQSFYKTGDDEGLYVFNGSTWTLLTTTVMDGGFY